MSLPTDPDAARAALQRELRLMGTPADPAFDAVVRLVQARTGRAVCGVTLLDDQRQWFHALQGEAPRDLPLSESFCRHVLHGRDPLVVEDLAADARFHAHPHVSGGARMRFYAGWPLVLEGVTVGSLCTLDPAPGALDAADRAAMADGARAIDALLQARLDARRARLQDARVRTASRTGSDWLWETGADGRLTWLSDASEDHLGQPPAHWIGQLGRELYLPLNQDGGEGYRQLLEALRERRPFKDLMVRRVAAQGELLVTISGSPVFAEDGSYRGYRGASRNVTAELHERERAQQAEQLLQNALDALRAGVAVTDGHGRVVASNRAWRQGVQGREDLSGLRWPQLLRRLVADGTYPDAVGREEAFLAERQSLARRTPPQMTVRFRERWLLLHDELLPGGGVVHLSLDITDRRLAELALARSEDRLKAVLAATADLLLVIGGDDLVQTVNPAGRELLARLGLPDPTGADVTALDLRDAQGRPFDRDTHPLRAGGPGERPLTVRLEGAEGRHCWMVLTRRPLDAAAAGDGAGPAGRVATLRDITGEREAASALAEAEQRWAFALEGAGDGVWDWNDDTRTAWYSPRWKAMLGHGPEEIDGTFQAWAERVHPEDLEEVKAQLQAHYRGETPVYHAEYRIRHKQGHWLWVRDRGRVVSRHPDGRARRIVGTHSDITREREADALRRERQALELSGRAKNEFLSRMSHEMRTPLNAVIGFAQLLSMRSAGPVGASDPAALIGAAGRHLLALVDDVLDLQRIEEGRLALDLRPLALGPLLTECRDLADPLAQAQGVSQTLDLTELPAVRADARHLRQVVLNLLSNAIKYNRPGGRVRLQARPADGPGGLVVLRVIDDGPGMTPAQLERIFQPFERLGRETGQVPGTGLGLVIARGIAHGMGATLDIDSTAGQGTVATLWLPVADEADAAPQDATTSTAVDGGPAPSVAVRAPAAARPRRVLYVEDNPVNALLMQEMLAALGGLECRVAEDGDAALALLRHWTPDLLVLDAHLPGIDGYELLALLRTRPALADVPAVMCSADAMPEDRERALAAGFRTCWTKPLDLQRIAADLAALPPVT